MLSSFNNVKTSWRNIDAVCPMFTVYSLFIVSFKKVLPFPPSCLKEACLNYVILARWTKMEWGQRKDGVEDVAREEEKGCLLFLASQVTALILLGVKEALQSPTLKALECLMAPEASLWEGESQLQLLLHLLRQLLLLNPSHLLKSNHGPWSLPQILLSASMRQFWFFYTLSTFFV